MTSIVKALRGWNLLSLTAVIGVSIIGAIQVKKLILYPVTYCSKVFYFKTDSIIQYDNFYIDYFDVRF
jgi:hypothetical protein